MQKVVDGLELIRFNASPLARIAQSVEQGIENPRVGGSIPPPGTTSTSSEVQPSQTISLKSSKINTLIYFYV